MLDQTRRFAIVTFGLFIVAMLALVVWLTFSYDSPWAPKVHEEPLGSVTPTQRPFPTHPFVASITPLFTPVPGLTQTALIDYSGNSSFYIPTDEAFYVDHPEILDLVERKLSQEYGLFYGGDPNEYARTVETIADQVVADCPWQAAAYYSLASVKYSAASDRERVLRARAPLQATIDASRGKPSCVDSVLGTPPPSNTTTPP